MCSRLQPFLEKRNILKWLLKKKFLEDLNDYHLVACTRAISFRAPPPPLRELARMLLMYCSSSLGSSGGAIIKLKFCERGYSCNSLTSPGRWGWRWRWGWGWGGTADACEHRPDGPVYHCSTLYVRPFIILNNSSRLCNYIVMNCFTLNTCLLDHVLLGEVR